MAKTYIISDTHFSHANIIAFESRPFDTVAQMDDAMVTNWNRVVGKADAVYHLGDFAFGGKAHIAALLARLNGRKHLVMGNHDMARKPAWWREAGFEEAFAQPICVRQFVWLSHEPMYMNRNMPYLNIHGHIHANRMVNAHREVYLNASAELNGYAPFDLDRAIAMKAREWELRENECYNNNAKS